MGRCAFGFSGFKSAEAAAVDFGLAALADECGLAAALGSLRVVDAGPAAAFALTISVLSKPSLSGAYFFFVFFAAFGFAAAFDVGFFALRFAVIGMSE
jgi:hypothetical protein